MQTRASTPTDRAVPGDGLTLHARDWGGSGQPVVLLHRLASNARIWDRVRVPPGRAGLRVVAIDQRGHGASDQPSSGYDFACVVRDLDAALAALELERPVLAGHSWGANVALQLAAGRPGAVAGLALVDGALTGVAAWAGATREGPAAGWPRPGSRCRWPTGWPGPAASSPAGRAARPGCGTTCGPGSRSTTRAWPAPGSASTTTCRWSTPSGTSGRRRCSRWSTARCCSVWPATRPTVRSPGSSGTRPPAPSTCSHPPPSPGSRTRCTTSPCSGRPSWPRTLARFANAAWEVPGRG